jgi:hypothetical protein
VGFFVTSLKDLPGLPKKLTQDNQQLAVDTLTSMGASARVAIPELQKLRSAANSPELREAARKAIQTIELAGK